MAPSGNAVDSQRSRLADGPILDRRRFTFAVAAVMVVGTIVRLPHFLIPIWAERPEFHPFRQTQTLLMVREILRNGIDFSSPLPLFGPPWSVPFEFPLYQNVAGALGMLLGLDDVIASRITSLVFFQASAVLLVILATRLIGRLGALAALVVWEFAQLTWSWATAPTIEFTAVFFVLLALVLSERLPRSPRPIAISVALSIVWSFAFLVKFSTAAVWLPFLFSLAWLLLGSPMRQVRSWVLVFAPVAVGAMSGYAFTLYGESVKSANVFSLFLTQPNLTEWYYGTLQQRLDASQWLHVAMHGNGISGSLIGIVGLGCLLIWKGTRTESVLASGALASVLSAICIFFNLYFVHDYYFLAIAPLLALIIGMLVARGYRILHGRLTRRQAAMAMGTGMLVILAMSWALSQGKPALGKFVAQEWRYGQSQEIASQTEPTDGVAVVGCSWSPEILYFADRRGLMLHDAWPPGNLQYAIPGDWVGRDIQYVFLCSDGFDVLELFDIPVEVTQISARLYRVEAAL